MALYTTKLIACPDSCPVLLSNGNLIAEGTSPDRTLSSRPRHYAIWEDPWPKPSYLFALVAGRLDVVESWFTTQSGRKVRLRIFVEPNGQAVKQTGHALASLKRAMKWDEERFGREYDLNEFNIVAVSDFNMGAMENKGLNLFNSRYILADPNLATDAQYKQIESIIGHEYFHNWSGNRVTCRDWFQLTLKEGLTVYRDQEFTADLHSRVTKRIEDVQRLREAQFKEDSSSLKHPIRPEAYVSMDNFYTTTVYEKGAEVVRMLATLLGKAAFREGLDRYFERHDGHAVQCEDFVAAMLPTLEKTSVAVGPSSREGKGAMDIDLGDLTQFFTSWYFQAGTPVLRVCVRHLPAEGLVELELEQDLTSISPPENSQEPQPFDFPLVLGLMDRNGTPIRPEIVPVSSEQSEAWLVDSETLSPCVDGGLDVSLLVRVRQKRTRFKLRSSREPPVLSLNRHFSAPIKLEWSVVPPPPNPIYSCPSSPSSSYPTCLSPFSAPAPIFSDNQPENDLIVRLSHDQDGFSRWDAAQTLYTASIKSHLTQVMAKTSTDSTSALKTGSPSHMQGEIRQILSTSLLTSLRGMLRLVAEKGPASRLDLEMLSLLFTLPSEGTLSQSLKPGTFDPLALHEAHWDASVQLATELEKELRLCFHALEEITRDQKAWNGKKKSLEGWGEAACRAMRNVLAQHLAHVPPSFSARPLQSVPSLLADYWQSAHTMTEKVGSLQSILVLRAGQSPDCCTTWSPAHLEELRKSCLHSFYLQYQHEPLALLHWFTLQARAPQPCTFATVRGLLDHPAYSFTNPNNVYCLLGGFSQNLSQFHQRGEGEFSPYSFLLQQVASLDTVNPSVAARLLNLVCKRCFILYMSK